MRISDWSSDVCSSDLVAALTTIIFKSPYLFPLLIIGGGMLSSFLYRNKEERELEETLIVNVNRKKVAAFFGILVLFALLGAIINRRDRKNVGWGEIVSVSVDLGGRRINKKKNK